MKSNDGTHLSGIILDNQELHIRWRNMAFMPVRQYNAPSRRVGRRFIQVLAVELTIFQQHCWNAERFVVFHMVILKRAWHVTKSCKIRRRINQWLDAWKAGEHEMVAADTAHTCLQYLSTSRA